jgi:hypothetical protein
MICFGVGGVGGFIIIFIGWGKFWGFCCDKKGGKGEEGER